jgi:F-actin capping protein, beta subunit
MSECSATSFRALNIYIKSDITLLLSAYWHSNCCATQQYRIKTTCLLTTAKHHYLPLALHTRMQGSAWESIHVVQVEPEVGGAKRALYKLNTTIMLSVDYDAASTGSSDSTNTSSSSSSSSSTNLSGNLSSAAEQTAAFNTADDHLVTLGRMIEKMENDVRSNIDGELQVEKNNYSLNVLLYSVHYWCVCAMQGLC